MNNSLPQGMVDIDGSVVETEEKGFSIQALKKTYHLRFSASDERDEWFELLRKITGKLLYLGNWSSGKKR